ncbi:MAG: hypothetical protein MJE77_17455 [Proteobacteria bacterium]|nr:hypothetical protein [Pseudomonadota bacterium]
MAIQRITAVMLSQRFGGTERYWERRRKTMVNAGLLNKIGRSFFGDLDTIEQAIATGGAEIWQTHKETRVDQLVVKRSAKPRQI